MVKRDSARDPSLRRTYGQTEGNRENLESSEIYSTVQKSCKYKVGLRYLLFSALVSTKEQI